MLIRDGKIEAVGTERRDREEELAATSAELSMLAGAWCCRDLSMRILIWFLPGIGSTILSGAREAKPTSKSPKAGGGIWSTVEKTRAASDVDLLAQAKKHARVVSARRHDNGRSEIGLRTHARR